MHKYIAHTQDDIKEMLGVIGVDSASELFHDIPEKIKITEFDLPKGLSEIELLNKAKTLASKNKNTNDLMCFLGAGAYDHYIPSVIDSIISRQEFYTSYTPYQPEISQGILQAIFEYQTMICELTGMDVANASMYDGATAAAEAMNVACNVSRKQNVLIASNVHPETKKVVNTYAKYSEKTVTEIDMSDGQIDIDDLKEKIATQIGAVIIQTPNFFGIVENIKEVADIVHENKAYLIVCVDPMSLGLLEAPGNLGADIVVGDAQGFGNALNFGGPYVGFFATNNKLMRKIPGRLVGQTQDVDGKRAFVLTIQTREQHIRREKATSNICSNQALNALMACIYMSTMGKEGISEVGNLCIQKSHYAYEKLISTGLFEPVYKAPFFKEFVIRYTGDKKELSDYLLRKNILFGYAIEKDYKEMKDCFLVAVTEKRTKEEIDYLVSSVQQVEKIST